MAKGKQPPVTRPVERPRRALRERNGNRRLLRFWPSLIGLATAVSVIDLERETIVVDGTGARRARNTWRRAGHCGAAKMIALVPAAPSRIAVGLSSLPRGGVLAGRRLFLRWGRKFEFEVHVAPGDDLGFDGGCGRVGELRGDEVPRTGGHGPGRFRHFLGEG